MRGGPGRLSGWLLLALCLTTADSLAEDPHQTGASELASMRTAFEHGLYESVLRRANELFDRGGLSDEELIELHKFAGLAAFNLSRMAEAERHLSWVLKLSPDYSLDPFVVPPPAVAYFEKLRKELSSTLNVLREERRLRAERLRKEADEKAQAARDAEAQRRRIDELSRQITVRTVENRSFILNFVPFGAGQFQQGRTGLGVALASLEGAFAATSIVAYFAYAAQSREETLELDDRLTPGGRVLITRVGIPPDRRNEAEAWSMVKWIAGGLFYGVYAAGVVDAVLHHQDQVVHTSVEEVPRPGVEAYLIPSAGGATAGLSLVF